MWDLFSNLSIWQNRNGELALFAGYHETTDTQNWYFGKPYTDHVWTYVCEL